MGDGWISCVDAGYLPMITIFFFFFFGGAGGGEAKRQKNPVL